MNEENIDVIMIVCAVICVLLMIMVYFIPKFIANVRKHSHRIAIFFLNLLAGGTGIGWVAAFVWAFIDKPVQLPIKVGGGNPTIAQEIKELNQLREQGIITEEEFENKKNELLNSNK